MIRFGDMPTPCGSVRSRVAFRTLSRFSSGSPMPIITTFNRESVAPDRFPGQHTSTWPTISPAVRFRSRPIRAVRQNLQSTGQPTWLEMQTVLLPGLRHQNRLDRSVII